MIEYEENTINILKILKNQECLNLFNLKLNPTTIFKRISLGVKVLYPPTENHTKIRIENSNIKLLSKCSKSLVYWIENFIKIINRQYLFRYYLLQDKAPSASFYNIREEHHQAEIRTLNNTIKLNTWISVLDDLKNDKDERIKKELEFWIN
ncbi:hypothetical protein GLOIN_2v1869471 [Rhizophagus clarus]|uniref:Uncharacterized protein n=1 Tax=Rhizophagus clarus TaxID=94130 RepID=A0A8H3M4W5_9GLOM|nr:hypothetical protein GLOIN_2v1869471 [Rhizophagus clarus]